MITALVMAVGAIIGGGISLFEWKKYKRDRERNAWLGDVANGNPPKKPDGSIHL